MSLELPAIRSALIRQEDTIIFALIERAQFKANAACYEAGRAPYTQLSGSACLLYTSPSPRDRG